MRRVHHQVAFTRLLFAYITSGMSTIEVILEDRSTLRPRSRTWYSLIIARIFSSTPRTFTRRTSYDYATSHQSSSQLPRPNHMTCTMDLRFFQFRFPLRTARLCNIAHMLLIHSPNVKIHNHRSHSPSFCTSQMFGIRTRHHFTHARHLHSFPS